VTPAPPAKGVSQAFNLPTSAIDTSHRPRRGRLTLELPSEEEDDDDDDDDDGYSAKISIPIPSSSVTSTRAKRQRRSVISYSEALEEYDDFNDDDQSASVALARQLQREEDCKAVRGTSFSIPVKRSARLSSFAVDSERDVHGPNPYPSKVKRKPATIADSDENELNSPILSPLNNVHQPRKKRKTTTTETTARSSYASHTDDDDEVDSQVLDYLSDDDEDFERVSDASDSDTDDDDEPSNAPSNSVNSGLNNANHVTHNNRVVPTVIHRTRGNGNRRAKNERIRLEKNHPELLTMWVDLENMPDLNAGIATQPSTISLQLKPFQLQGLAWMKAMEKTSWKGGLLGDEMGLGKTIQAVSLIMSDYPAKAPSLVLLPPVALGQWQDEIAAYTGNRLKTIVFHGTNSKSKNLSTKELKKFDVIIMSYNSLESLYRKQEKGVKRKDGLYKEKSVIHQTKFHRVILDEAHCIKVRCK
jgi:DNA repair protein RAD16